jgi:hypothetical protein
MLCCIMCLTLNCFLSLGSYIIQKTFCWWSTVSSVLSHVQPRCFSLSYWRNLCVNQAHIKRIMWGIFKIILGMYEFWALIFQWSWLINICVNLGHVLHRTIFNNLLSICLSKNVVSKCMYVPTQNKQYLDVTIIWKVMFSTCACF